jgi:hypothetical protein
VTSDLKNINHAGELNESIHFIINSYARSPMAENIEAEIAEIEHHFEK